MNCTLVGLSWLIHLTVSIALSQGHQQSFELGKERVIRVRSGHDAAVVRKIFDLSQHVEGIGLHADNRSLYVRFDNEPVIRVSGTSQCREVSALPGDARVLEGFRGNEYRAGLSFPLSRKFKWRDWTVTQITDKGCIDTPNNRLVLRRPGKRKMTITGLGEIHMCEFDIDSDGATELIIVNLYICDCLHSVFVIR